MLSCFISLAVANTLRSKGGMDLDGFRFEVTAHYFWEVKAGTSQGSSPVKIKENKCSLGCLLPASFLISYIVVGRTA